MSDADDERRRMPPDAAEANIIFVVDVNSASPRSSFDWSDEDPLSGTAASTNNIYIIQGLTATVVRPLDEQIFCSICGRRF